MNDTAIGSSKSDASVFYGLAGAIIRRSSSTTDVGIRPMHIIAALTAMLVAQQSANVELIHAVHRLDTMKAKRLLASGVPVDCVLGIRSESLRDSNGGLPFFVEEWTPLLTLCKTAPCAGHSADARWRRARVLELGAILLARGADPNRTDSAGLSCLSLALRNGHESLAIMLIGAGASVVGKRGANEDASWPLLAAVQGCETLVPLLIAKGAAINRTSPHSSTTVAHLAAAAANWDLLEWLLQHGADPRIRNAKGRSVLDLLDAQLVIQTDPTEARRLLAIARSRAPIED